MKQEHVWDVWDPLAALDLRYKSNVEWRFFLEEMVKMTLKVKVNVNDLHFQYHLRVSQDVCLMQIWWF